MPALIWKLNIKLLLFCINPVGVCLYLGQFGWNTNVNRDSIAREVGLSPRILGPEAEPSLKIF